MSVQLFHEGIRISSLNSLGTPHRDDSAISVTPETHPLNESERECFNSALEDKDSEPVKGKEVADKGPKITANALPIDPKVDQNAKKSACLPLNPSVDELFDYIVIRDGLDNRSQVTASMIAKAHNGFLIHQTKALKKGHLRRKTPELMLIKENSPKRKKSTIRRRLFLKNMKLRKGMKPFSINSSKTRKLLRL